ncbi:MAG: hypothetical protein LBU87_01270 [Lactobacillales bacterium]|jgi:hypothetical protein|nr:hypothetical protein [Lactobacillales bacterium]
MKNSESGRSMVEMLGVLAIIGVLSIGGIAGYMIAMYRWRANELLDTAAKVSVIAMSKTYGTGIANLVDLGIADSAGVGTVAGQRVIIEGDDTGDVIIYKYDADFPEGIEKAVKSIAGNKVKAADQYKIELNFDNN